MLTSIVGINWGDDACQHFRNLLFLLPDYGFVAPVNE